jgi:hypothetical protein
MPLQNCLTRRSTLGLLGAVALPSIAFGQSSNEAKITIYKDPSCSCCGNWQKHMQVAGFVTVVEETTNVASLKSRLGVSDDLASCHTALIAGYVIEGHVPATAVKRLLAEKPNATGLAVPGMPAGAPGMGGSGEAYDVILFGTAGRSTFMRFVGDREV